MSSAELVLVGTLGGAALGALATLGATYVQVHLARRDRQATELTAAGSDYLAAADRLANQYAQLPPRDSYRWIDRKLDRIVGERAVIMIARLSNRLIVGDRWEILTDDFLRASARFRLAAPASLLPSIENLNDLMATWSARTGPSRLDEWRALRLALEQEFRETLEAAAWSPPRRQ